MWFLGIFCAAHTVTFDFIAFIHYISNTLKAFSEIRSVLFDCRSLHGILCVHIWFWNWSSTRLQLGYDLACRGRRYYYNDECATPKPVQLHIYVRCALRVRKPVNAEEKCARKIKSMILHGACTCWATDKFIAKCMPNFSFDECRNLFSFENRYQLPRLLSFSSGQTDHSLFEETVRCNDQFADVPITRTCVNDVQPVSTNCNSIFPSDRAISIVFVFVCFLGELIFGARTARRHVCRQSMCSAIDKHKSRELVRLHLLHSIEQIWQKIEINLRPSTPLTDAHGTRQKKEISSRTSNRKRYHFFDIKFTRHYVL